MTIDLHIPSNWLELSTEQLRDIVDLASSGIRREEFLLIMLCKLSGIKMVAATTDEDDKRVVHTKFVDGEGHVFDLEDWQVTEFCERLAFTYDEKMPIGAAWPFKWNRYLMDTPFGDWFHADALVLGFTLDGDLEKLKGAMKDLGDPHDNPTPADVTLMLNWYDCFKGWLQERYPLVFQKAEPGEAGPTSPIEARQNIMLMLTGGRPQDNEAIERSNMHDVLAALQHKIEEEKHYEEQLHRI